MDTKESSFLQHFKLLYTWQILSVGVMTFIVWKLIHGIIRFWRFHKYFNSMPGDTDFHWIFGNMHKAPITNTTEMLKYKMSLVKKHPRWYRYWLSSFHVGFSFVHPTTVQLLIKTPEPKPRGMGSAYILAIDWLGEGLLISNGRKWARNRKLLTPAFHFDILQPYINVKNEAADILLDKIGNCVKLNKSFELFHYVSLYTLDVLLRCAFSYDDDIQNLGESHPYIKAINELGDAMAFRALRPYLFPDFIYFLTPSGRHFSKNCTFVHNFAEKIISKRKKELIHMWSLDEHFCWCCGNCVWSNSTNHSSEQRNTNVEPRFAEILVWNLVILDAVFMVYSLHTDVKIPNFKDGGVSEENGIRKYLDFLDILLKARDENNEGLSPLDIRNEVDTFLFEGYDTTTSALSWIMYSLATHPEHQKKVQEEVDGIYSAKGTEYITADDFPKMEYLTQCLKEGLRLHCPVHQIQRQLTKPLQLDGCTIPEGTTIGIQIYNLHHHPDVWENPDEFRPERFSPGNVKNRDAFAFVPFSAGPRNCIGQNFAMHEMKVMLARILHKYTLEIDPSVPVLKKLSIVMKSENGIHVFARPRNQSV